MKKYYPSIDEQEIVKYWYEIRRNIKAQDPITGFYLSSKTTHTGFKFVNAENRSVTSEKIQIEIPLPCQLWKYAETGPGSRIGGNLSRSERHFVRKQGWDVKKKAPKGIRFVGYRTVQEAATIVKSWIDNPVLFVEAIQNGSGVYSKWYA